MNMSQWIKRARRGLIRQREKSRNGNHAAPIRMAGGISRAWMGLERLELRLMMSHAGGEPPIDDIFVQADDPVEPEIHFPSDGTTVSSATLTYTLRADGLPEMNTRPGSRGTIYLDFDGEGTNTPYSVDADATTFNAAEQQQIAECVRHIDAYYAMFDITVTTVKPANLTTSPTAWLVCSNSISGGFSSVNVYPNTSAKSFNQSSDARGRQSGLAHELGHNFGLSHQSAYDQWAFKTAEYIGALDPLHGVIMGVDYAGTIHKFILGHDSGDVSTLQDDIDTIADDIVSKGPAGYTGDGFRPDDHSNVTTSATALQFHDLTQYSTGIIERLADSDAFSFTSAGGRYAIDILRDDPSGVDLRVSIFDSLGNLIAHEDGDPRTQSNWMVYDHHLSMDLAAGTYYAVVSGHGNYGDQGSYLVRVDPLAADWHSEDVGLTAIGGYAGFDVSTGVFTLGGSGSSITSTADALQFAYQTLKGDGSIIARITGIENTNSAARVGLMIRESLDPGARSAGIFVTPANGESWIRRTAANASPSNTTVDSGVAFAPLYLKLQRSGNSFSAFKSTDGINFTQLGASTTISMGSTAFIGLAVTSANNRSLNDASFSNVTVAASGAGVLNPTPTLNALAAPSDLAVGTVAYNSVALSWTNVAGNAGYSIERSSDGATYSQINATAADIATFTDSTVVDGQMYFYRVRAKDAAGVSAASSVVTATTRAGLVSGLNITSFNTTKLVIDWTDASGETGYRVERSVDGVSGWTTFATVGANVNSVTDSSLSAITTRSYRVVTLDAQGDSVTSSVVTGETRLPAVTGLSMGAVTSNSIAFSWTDLSQETGYKIERSTDATNYSVVATLAANTTSYTDTGLNATTEYYYRILGTHSITQSIYHANFFAATAPSAALPAPWVSQDVGSVGGAGSAKEAGGTFTLIGAGNRIDSTSDEFRFVYQTLAGDGSITAKITAIEGTNDNAKAGVMIRESTAGNAKNVATLLTDQNGVRIQYRTSAGGSTTSTTGLSTAGTPYWVRLTRAGNSFLSEYSSDGTSWTAIATQTVSMNVSVLIGLVVCSTDDTLLNTSTFTNVTVANANPTVATPAAASPNPLTTGFTSTLSVLGADDHGESNLTYTWAATTLPPGAAAPTFSVNGTNGAKSTVATFSKAGAYTLTATLTDAGGLTAASSVNVTVNQQQTAVVVSPNPLNIRGGLQQQFTASVNDQFGDAMAVQPAITWASTLGSITSGGLFTAPALTAGGTVTATAGATVGSAAVNAVNSAPFVSSPIADLNVNEDASDVVLNLAAIFSDPDAGETLTYSLISNTNATLLAANPAGSQLTLHFNANQFGAANVTVRATDVAGVFVEDNFDVVVVSVNDSPTVATPAAASPNLLTLGTTTNLSVRGADDQGEGNLIYTWAATTLPAGAAAPTFSVNGTNAAKSSIATFSKAGFYTFTVAMTDAGGLAVASSVNVMVNQKQTAVVVSPDPLNIRGGLQQQFTASARDQFGNAMAAQPAFTWASTLGSITSGGLFTAPALTAGGTVTATAGSTVGSAVVNAVNAAPFVSSPIADLNVNANASDVVLNLAAIFSDPDAGETLTYSLIANTNTTLLAANLAGSQLTLHFNADQFGAANVTVRATDAAGAFVEDAFALTVDSSVAGDLTNDGLLTAADIDALHARLGGDPQIYDLTGDNQVTTADVDYLLESLMHRRRGDADLDGDVDAADLSALRSHLGGAGGGWAFGDFDGDGDIDASDLATIRSNLGLPPPGFDPAPPGEPAFASPAPSADAPVSESDVQQAQAPEVAVEDSGDAEPAIELFESSPPLQPRSGEPAAETPVESEVDSVVESADDLVFESLEDPQVDLLSSAWMSLFGNDSGNPGGSQPSHRKQLRAISCLSPDSIHRILG